MKFSDTRRRPLQKRRLNIGTIAYVRSATGYLNPISFFTSDARWLTLYEVRLRTKQNAPAGNIDIVLVAFDERGRVTDFGALEIQ